MRFIYEDFTDPVFAVHTISYCKLLFQFTQLKFKKLENKASQTYIEQSTVCFNFGKEHQGSCPLQENVCHGTFPRSC